MSRTVEWSQANEIWHATPNVVAAWAFGSAQAGQVRPGGDVDVAVLLNKPLSFDAQLDLLATLQSALQFERIDLVILNDANAMLRFEAISGRRLFCRDVEKTAEFASLTAREYEDELAQWQRAMKQQ